MAMTSQAENRLSLSRLPIRQARDASPALPVRADARDGASSRIRERAQTAAAKIMLMSESEPPQEPKTAPAPTAGASPRKPALSGPKRHHFLPRFYLENFARDGHVAVDDREEDQVRIQQPVNTGVIGHFYTMEDAQGRRRFELEQLLSEYEGKAKPAIDKLAARDNLEAEERADLAIFIALGAMRTPDVIDSLKAFNSGIVTDVMKAMFANVEDVAARLRDSADFADKTDEAVFAEAKLMVTMAQKGGVQVEAKHQWAVGEAIRLGLLIAPIFAGRDWVVLHRDNEKKSFVTTDAPVLLTTVAPRPGGFWAGVGYGNSDALVYFPLKSSCMLALLGDEGDMRHAEVSAEQVRQLNLAMAAECQRFVVGRDEALVRSLADTVGLATSSWRPKMQRS